MMTLSRCDDLKIGLYCMVHLPDCVAVTNFLTHLNTFFCLALLVPKKCTAFDKKNNGDSVIF